LTEAHFGGVEMHYKYKYRYDRSFQDNLVGWIFTLRGLGERDMQHSIFKLGLIYVKINSSLREDRKNYLNLLGINSIWQGYATVEDSKAPFTAVVITCSKNSSIDCLILHIRINIPPFHRFLS
jgi:hypothetical protein